MLVERSKLRWVQCFPYKNDFPKVHCAPIRCPVLFLSHASSTIYSTMVEPLGLHCSSFCVPIRFKIRPAVFYLRTCLSLLASITTWKAYSANVVRQRAVNRTTWSELTFIYYNTRIQTRWLASRSFPNITFPKK